MTTSPRLPEPPLPPWWSYEDRGGCPALAQAPDLPGAAKNDTAPEEEPDAS